MGQKAKKGEVSISEEQGRIRLRWRHNKLRYSLNLPFPFSPEYLELAKIKAAEIKLDIFRGCFDTSLEKYKEQDTFTPPVKVVETKPINKVEPKINILDLFRDWVVNYINGDIENNANYSGALAMIRRWGNFKPDAVPALLAGEKISPKTYNRRKGCLSKFYDWLIKYHNYPSNPLIDIQNKRDNRPPNYKRQPLNQDEIKKLLEAIRLDTYCPGSSGFRHSHYYPFLYFMFRTGVRNEEAIGLRIKHLNFHNKSIHICEVMARTAKGTSDKARVRKNTKNGKERLLPLSKDLIDIIEPLVRGRVGDELVFLSPTGKSIDDRMFQRRILKPVLEKLELGDRDLYAARHSFGSRALELGTPPATTAQFMGNNVATLIKAYAKVINMATELPEM